MDESRREQFHEDVAQMKLKTDASKSDAPLRIAGILLMIGGVIGCFVGYKTSLALDDSRDILSQVVLSMAFLGFSLLGAALYATAVISRMLRLFLLRSLAEGQAQTDQIAEALSTR